LWESAFGLLFLQIEERIGRADRTGGSRIFQFGGRSLLSKGMVRALLVPLRAIGHHCAPFGSLRAIRIDSIHAPWVWWFESNRNGAGNFLDLVSGPF
jgi:hypothetical protein